MKTKSIGCYNSYCFKYNYSDTFLNSSHIFQLNSLSLSLSLSLSVFIIVSSAPSDKQCQSLLQVSLQHKECTPHGDCTGLTCVKTLSIMSINTSFTVDKCRDPILVIVTVTTTNGNTYHLTFDQSTTGTIDGHSFNWSMSRNDSYLQVKVHLNYYLLILHV